MWFHERGLYSYQQRVRVITLFPSIFCVLFLHVERVCKSLQVAHLHNAARASVFSIVFKS